MDPSLRRGERFQALLRIRRRDVRGHGRLLRARLPGPERGASPDMLVNDRFFGGGGEVACPTEGFLHGSDQGVDALDDLTRLHPAAKEMLDEPLKKVREVGVELLVLPARRAQPEAPAVLVD